MDLLDIVRAEAAALEQGRPFAAVTIVHAEGTTSRTSGKMLVYDDGRSLGTVGGGAVEFAAVNDALACIRSGESALKVYGGSGSGLPLDGEITVWIEVAPRAPLLVVVGGGHVGNALLRLGRFLGYDTWLVDDRLPEALDGSAELCRRFLPVPDYLESLRALEIPADAAVVLCSYSHATDRDALSAVIAKPVAYLGMLGSRKKIARIFASLREEGVSEAQLAAVRTPIGLDLGGETPEEVALSIMAEILAERNRRESVTFSRAGNGT
jgi:xanthine dehydrogenase accessory factor